MKQTRRLTNGLVACAVAFAMVSSLAAQTATEGGAKVVRIKGPARFSTGNNVWQPLKVGAVLSPGTVVQTSTEQGSYLDLVLGDGEAPLPATASYKPGIPNSMNPGAQYQPAADQNVVRVWENTALGIDKLTASQTGADQVGETQLDLKAGRITGSVKKQSGASKYEIKLPSGVAGVKGAVYDVRAEGVVRVLVGSVVLAWVDSKSGNVTTQVVMGGQQFDARSGQVSAIPSSEISAFDKLVASMGTGSKASASVATYILDKTVIPVSPVVGPAGAQPDISRDVPNTGNN